MILKQKEYEKKFFEDWAIDYDERRNKSFLEKSKHGMLQIIANYKKNKETFLEIGLGTGELFELLSNKFHFVSGMDISEGMVRRTNSKKIKKKDLFVGDGCNLPLQSNLFDFIICQDVLEHVPNQEKLILGICQVLKPNGIAIITTPNPLWAPILYFAEKLKMKVEEGEHKFVFLPKLVNKTLKNSQCNILSNDSFMMLPIKSKLDNLIEPLCHKNIFSRFGFSQMCIINKKV